MLILVLYEVENGAEHLSSESRIEEVFRSRLFFDLQRSFLARVSADDSDRDPRSGGMGRMHMKGAEKAYMDGYETESYSAC